MYIFQACYMQQYLCLLHVVIARKDSEYSICFSIADMNTTFKPQKANNRTIDWNLCNSIQYQNISDNINHLPELFIYLLDKKGNVVSFQRIEAKSFYLSDDIIIIKSNILIFRFIIHFQCVQPFRMHKLLQHLLLLQM
jgi:hypothetical protein